MMMYYSYTLCPIQLNTTDASSKSSNIDPTSMRTLSDNAS
jgi:hypothetical protein